LPAKENAIERPESASLINRFSKTRNGRESRGLPFNIATFSGRYVVPGGKTKVMEVRKL
jgi:hypothetical protein